MPFFLSKFVKFGCPLLIFARLFTFWIHSFQISCQQICWIFPLPDFPNSIVDDWGLQNCFGLSFCCQHEALTVHYCPWLCLLMATVTTWNCPAICWKVQCLVTVSGAVCYHFSTTRLYFGAIRSNGEQDRPYPCSSLWSNLYCSKNASFRQSCFGFLKNHGAQAGSCHLPSVFHYSWLIASH